MSALECTWLRILRKDIVAQMVASFPFVFCFVFIVGVCHPPLAAVWLQEAVTVAGGNGRWNQPDQLHSPTDVIVGKMTDSLSSATKGIDELSDGLIKTGQAEKRSSTTSLVGD